jgi:hypothetical protein
MVNVLLPNVLQQLPVAIPQSIRHFAKQFDSVLIGALVGLPNNMSVKKIQRKGTIANYLTSLSRKEIWTIASQASLVEPSYASCQSSSSEPNSAGTDVCRLGKVGL